MRKKKKPNSTYLVLSLLDIAAKYQEINTKLSENPFREEKSLIDFFCQLPTLLNAWSQNRKNFSELEERLSHAVVVYILLKIHAYFTLCPPEDSIRVCTSIVNATKSSEKQEVEFIQSLFSTLYNCHHPNADEANLIMLLIHHAGIPWLALFGPQGYRANDYLKIDDTRALLTTTLDRSVADYLIDDVSTQFRKDDGSLQKLDEERNLKAVIINATNAAAPRQRLAVEFGELMPEVLEQLTKESLDSSDTECGYTSYCAFLTVLYPDQQITDDTKRTFISALDKARKREAESLAEATRKADEARAELEALELEAARARQEERAAHYAYLAELEQTRKTAIWEARVAKAAQLGAAPSYEAVAKEPTYVQSELEKALVVFYRTKEDSSKKLILLATLCQNHQQAIEENLLAQVELALLRAELLFQIQKTDKRPIISSQIREQFETLRDLHTTGLRREDCEFSMARLKPKEKAAKAPQKKEPAPRQLEIKLPKEVTALLEALSERYEMGALMGEAYAVGGCVRDALQGKKPKDFDIVYFGQQGLLADEQYKTEFKKKLSTKLKCRVDFKDSPIPNLLVIEAGAEKYEILLSKHKTLKEDALVRDSRCNALFANKKGLVIDPLGQGCEQALKTVYAPASSLEQFLADPVRILRALDFKLIRNYTLSPELDTAIAQQLEQRKALSLDDLKTALGQKLGHFAAKLKALLFNALKTGKTKELAEILSPNLFNLLSDNAKLMLRKNPDYLKAMSEALVGDALSRRLAELGVFLADPSGPAAAGAGTAPTTRTR